MGESGLSEEEKQILLREARRAIELAVNGQPLPWLDLAQLPPRLREAEATFVTLTLGGKLRGCIGSLEACQPLIEDVREHAVSAALDDYRFPPVRPAEVERLRIEISRLTAPQPLMYDTPADLLKKLRPGFDGVVIRDEGRRATFLPQVWQSLPDPKDFLDHLCQKMGSPRNLWRQKRLEVQIYQVEEFHE
ncbi:MAG: AmmeMemoRadiSam system protein A [Chloroflexota bacterium]|jgi:AmmeMemoRadiSam system protein A